MFRGMLSSALKAKLILVGIASALASCAWQFEPDQYATRGENISSRPASPPAPIRACGGDACPCGVTCTCGGTTTETSPAEFARIVKKGMWAIAVSVTIKTVWGCRQIYQGGHIGEYNRSLVGHGWGNSKRHASLHNNKKPCWVVCEAHKFREFQYCVFHWNTLQQQSANYDFQWLRAGAAKIIIDRAKKICCPQFGNMKAFRFHRI